METIRPEQIKAIDSPSDGQVPAYDSSTKKFEWVTVSGIEGAIALSDLTDVNVAGVTDGEVLTYDDGTSTWIPSAGGGAIALDDLSDVDTTGVANGDALIYDSDTSTWLAAPVSGSANLDGNGLTNQVAVWSGTHSLYGHTGLTFDPATNILTAKTIAGIALTPGTNAGNFSINLTPGASLLTGNRNVYFPNADLTFSSGGTLSLAGFTVTASATGSVAYLNVANTFSKTNLVQPTTNSAGAFTVKDKDSNPVFDVDTTNRRVGVGDRSFPIYPLDVTYDTDSNYLTTVVTVSRFARNCGDYPSAGFGSLLYFTLGTYTADDRSAGTIEYLWATATDATRKARVRFTVYDTAEREAFRIEADGSNPMIGFLGAVASARSTGWAVSNVTPTKVIDADSTTLNELADLYGTLITELLTKGILGA